MLFNENSGEICVLEQISAGPINRYAIKIQTSFMYVARPASEKYLAALVSAETSIEGQLEMGYLRWHGSDFVLERIAGESGRTEVSIITVPPAPVNSWREGPYRLALFPGSSSRCN